MSEKDLKKNALSEDNLENISGGAKSKLKGNVWTINSIAGNYQIPKNSVFGDGTNGNIEKLKNCLQTIELNQSGVPVDDNDLKAAIKFVAGYSDYLIEE